jgi:hypothetical protein
LLRVGGENVVRRIVTPRELPDAAGRDVRDL